ncbi:nuclease-related domain-containing protein [Lactobacillus sp.]|uniref:nuclease-related domain-containing protein n=1 Tax=Lactobacillus sp. TaxID=1591 RepID=UPI0019BE8B90|nr:nuclease-related domain-containing protein [Lactobacillus sp.]MBD5429158.1 NERD domain-containing protein [Lactobacillus sp.]
MKIKGSLNGWKVIVVLGLITLLLFLKNNLAIDVLAIIIGCVVYFGVAFFIKDRSHLSEQKERLDEVSQQLTTLKTNQNQQLNKVADQENQLVDQLRNHHYNYEFPNDEGLTFQTYELTSHHQNEVSVIRKVFDKDQRLRYQLIYNKRGQILQYWQFLTPDTYTKADFRQTPPKFDYHSNYAGELDINNLPPIDTVNAQLQSKDWYYQQLKNKVRHQLAVIKNLQKQDSNWFLRKDKDGSWFKDSIAIDSLLTAEKVGRQYFNIKNENDLSRNNLPGLAKIDKLYQKLNIQLEHLNKLRRTSYKKLKVDVPEKVVNLTEHDLSSLGNKYADEVAKLMVEKTLREIGQNKFIGHNVVVASPNDKDKNSPESSQIDNLVVSNKGIFCIETETRMITSQTYNVNNGYQEINSQITKHRDAIEHALKQSQDPVIKKLLEKPESKYLIHNLIVFIGRTSQNFSFKNSDVYTDHGIEVLKLDELQKVISNGVNTVIPISLTNEEVKALGRILIDDTKNLSIIGQAGNLVFWNGETSEKNIDFTLNQVIELTNQLEIMNDCLDHLIELKHEIFNLKVQRDAIEELKQVDVGYAQARQYFEKQLRDHDNSFTDAVI